MTSKGTIQDPLPDIWDIDGLFSADKLVTRICRQSFSCFDLYRLKFISARGSAVKTSSGRKRTSDDAALLSGGGNSKRSKVETKSKWAITETSHRNHLLQCAGYALEMLSNGGLRTHAIGMLISDDRFELLYYDRSIHVKSEPLSLFPDPTLFIHAFDAMARLSLHDFGQDRVILNRSIMTRAGEELPIAQKRKLNLQKFPIFRENTIKLKDGTELELGLEVFHQHALIGRGTVVVLAIVTNSRPSSSKWPKRVAIKFSYASATRDVEAEIVDLLRMRAKETNEDMLNYLPQIFHREERELEGVPKRVEVYLASVNDKVYERRQLHITVQEVLFPLNALVKMGKVNEVGDCFRNISKCDWPFLIH